MRLFKIVGILIVPCLGDFSLFHKNMEREYSKEYVAVISTILSSRSLTCSSASVTLLLIHSSVLFIPVCSFVILGLWKTFIASSPFFPRDPESSSLSLFWILLLEDCLSPFHLLVFSGDLSYSFIWDIILCLLILISFLWLWFSFWRQWDCLILASSACPLVNESKGLCKLLDGRDWQLGKIDLALGAGPCPVKL